jgi:hypothetical protein
MNSRAFWILGALLWSAGCSLLLELPADCVTEDCGGYLCNEEKTGCMAQCGQDGDCAAGHLCDAGRCEPWSCAPDSGARKLLASITTTRDIFPAWADSGGDGHLATAQVVGGTLSVQLFAGVTLQPGPSRALATAESRPQSPWMAWDGSRWAVIWVTSLESGGRPQQQLRFALLDDQAQVVLGPKTLWQTTVLPNTGETEKSIDDPKLYWDDDEGRFLIVWSTRLNTSDLFLLALDAQGRTLEGEEEIPHAAAVRLTRTGFDSVDPHLIPRAGVVYDIAYREGSPQVDVLLRSVDLQGTRQGDDINISATQGQVTSHGLARIRTGAALAFAEQGVSAQLFRAQLQRDRTLAGGEKVLIDRNYAEALDARLASASPEEYGVLFTATRGQRRDVYLSRYKDNGARVGLPFPVTQDREGAPTQPRFAATRRGYFVLFQETEGVDAGAVFARHWTCAAP